MPVNRETEAASRQLAERAREQLGLPRREPPRPANSAAAETVGTAFAVGVANGLHGGERGEVMIRKTVPADLLAGVILSIIARLAGHGPDPEPHTAAIATGALVGCAYRYGERQGAAQRRAAVASSP